MTQFSFEHSFQFDEHLYVQLNTIFSKKTKALNQVLAIALGVVCLFWNYSILIGIFILLFVLISSLFPRLIPKTAANNYKSIKYLQGKLTYGLSEKKLWIKGEQLSVSIGWEQIVVWDEKNEWLKISANHIPTLWFKSSDLKKQNIYENIIGLCETNGVKFNS